MFRVSVLYAFALLFFASRTYCISRPVFVSFVLYARAPHEFHQQFPLPYPGTRSVGNVLQYTTSWHCIPIFIYLASSFRHGRLHTVTTPDVSPSALLGWVAQMTFDDKLVKHRCANQCVSAALLIFFSACVLAVLTCLSYSGRWLSALPHSISDFDFPKRLRKSIGALAVIGRLPSCRPGRRRKRGARDASRL